MNFNIKKIIGIGIILFAGGIIFYKIFDCLPAMTSPTLMICDNGSDDYYWWHSISVFNRLLITISMFAVFALMALIPKIKRRIKLINQHKNDLPRNT